MNDSYTIVERYLNDPTRLLNDCWKIVNDCYTIVERLFSDW